MMGIIGLVTVFGMVFGGYMLLNVRSTNLRDTWVWGL